MKVGSYEFKSGEVFTIKNTFTCAFKQLNVMGTKKIILGKQETY